MQSLVALSVQRLAGQRHITELLGGQDSCSGGGSSQSFFHEGAISRPAVGRVESARTPSTLAF